MPKHLILIHGRSFKPASDTLRQNWFAAIEHGLKRDRHEEGIDAFNEIPKQLVYYGDISNRFLRTHSYHYDEDQDVADRERCLQQLMEYSREDFLGHEGENHYKTLPGASSVKERLGSIFGDVAEFLGVAEPIIRLLKKDLAHYWEPDSTFGSDVRWKLTEPLKEALMEGDDVLLVAHSLGTMISYDVLWKFSHYGEYGDLRDRLLRSTPPPVTFATLGSPLGNETIKTNLKGCKANGARRYPYLIRAWHNFAAEDDYISHDETLKDDYRKMLRDTETMSIHDYNRDHRQGFYNLAVRHEESNPHHGAGYLVHPHFTDFLADWLLA